MTLRYCRPCDRYTSDCPHKAPARLPKALNLGQRVWSTLQRLEVVWGLLVLSAFCWMVYAYLHGQW